MKKLILAVLFFNVANVASSDDLYLSVPDYHCFHGQATLENIRGGGGIAKYANQDRTLLKKLSSDQIIFGVFDGHGKYGEKVASFVAVTLPDLLQEDPLTQTVLEDANAALQAELASKDFTWASGTTAVFGVLDRDKLIVSNTGDSRLLVARNGMEIFSTVDHKPNNPAELERITIEGGVINGHYIYDIDLHYGLAVSRTLGDIACHRDDIVIEQPQIDVLEIKEQDIIIAASDGLFDVMTNDEVIDFVNHYYHLGYNVTKVAEYLVQEARYRGSYDDITAVIFVLS